MNSYGWKVKLWKFQSNEESEQKYSEYVSWIEKWKHKYQIRKIFVNNAWAVEYCLLLHF